MQLSNPTRPSVAVCLPVWNRGDLLAPCLTSLLARLDGLDAEVWLVDNGSDRDTRGVIHDAARADTRITVISFPHNMGIPHAVNVFVRAAMQPCDIAGRRPPGYLMLLDADAIVEHPVRDLIELLERDTRYGAVSGHRSIEHPALARREIALGGRLVIVDEKRVERMFCLLMRAGDLMAMTPFPHDTAVDVDWQIMARHPRSLAASGRVVAAVDHAVHIGLYDSTWHPDGVPAGPAEIAAIDAALESAGLMTPERRARASRYRERHAAAWAAASGIEEAAL